MERIRRFFKKFGKGLKAKGYTLIEVAAVVAVSATLAAVVVPIAVDQTTAAKVVSAKQDCQAIGGALASFYKDVGYWPTYNGTGTFTTTDYASSAYAIRVLRSGVEGTVTVTADHDPKLAAAACSPFTTADILENHLVKDSPGGAPVVNGYRGAGLSWKGPYIDSMAQKRDPWGNNYLVMVGAMAVPSTLNASAPAGSKTGTLVGNKLYGWVISAGPNGTLETSVNTNALAGDDVGFVVFAFEAPKG